MKKLTLYTMMTVLSLTFIPTQLKAGSESTPVSTAAPKPVDSPEARALLARLDEIKAMDKSKLTSSEKKELRKEVRSTEKYLSEHGGGIYLSLGAIIIIVLLLIILL